MDPILVAGLELMLIGMGTVFVFLMVLVVATKTMSSLVQRFAPVPPNLAIPMMTDGSHPSAEEVAAISAALHQHRINQNS